MYISSIIKTSSKTLPAATESGRKTIPALNFWTLLAARHHIPNGCLDAYEVKVNIDISKHQEMVKLISQVQRFFHLSMAY